MTTRTGRYALEDPPLRAWLQQIIQDQGLTTVVETGIDWGGSTRAFAQMVPRVIGIDNDERRLNLFMAELLAERLTVITLVNANSPDGLRQLVNAGDIDAAQTLFFLDAHWQAYWPLLDEIAAIPRGQGVLVMHDVQVPDWPSLGFDTYNGQSLTYAYVQPALTSWSPTHRIAYNDDRVPSPLGRRGAMVVWP